MLGQCEYWVCKTRAFPKASFGRSGSTKYLVINANGFVRVPCLWNIAYWTCYFHNGSPVIILQHIHFISNVVLSITVLYFTSWLELYSYVCNIAVLEQFRCLQFFSWFHNITRLFHNIVFCTACPILKLSIKYGVERLCFVSHTGSPVDSKDQ